MSQPIRLGLRPVQPLSVKRVPALPIRIERLTQDAPIVRLGGLQVLEVAYTPAPFEATFAAAPSWTVNHNLARRPTAVRVLSPGGVECEAEVIETTLNQLVVIFASAQAGRVIVF